MNPKKLIPLFLILILPIVGCAQQTESEDLTTADFISKMKTDSSLVVLDVRNDDELTGPLGHIDGIVHIPLPKLNTRLSELEKYRENEIAVICRSGRRSGIAANILRDKGFNAKNVLGGMQNYRRKIPLEEAVTPNE